MGQNLQRRLAQIRPEYGDRREVAQLGARETSMATLTISRIRCTEQEDWTGDDDIQIVVHASSRQVVWQGSMDTNQTRQLSGIEVEFSGTVRIQLMEEDWPDANDDLGSITVSESSAAAVDIEGRFTGDDADYTVWYRVSREQETPADSTPPHCTPADPPSELPDDYGPVCDEDTDDDHGAVPCPMGNLGVMVHDSEGNALAGAAVRVVETGATGVTSPAGSHDFGPVIEGDYTVEASKEGYSPNPGTDSTHVVRDTTCTATVVLSTVIVRVTPTGDEKWYVNESPNQAGHHGRDVAIRAEVTPAVAGVRIHFTLVRGTNNNSGLTGGDRASMSPASALTNASGVAETTLTLSTYGGDEFRVSAGLNAGDAPGSEGTAQTGKLVVWKKLYFDVVEMYKSGNSGPVHAWKASIQRRVIGDASHAFKHAFVELQDTGQRHRGRHVDNFAQPEDGFVWADGYTSNAGVPLKVHFCVVDRAFPSSGTYGPTDTPYTENFPNGSANPLTSAGRILVHEFNGVQPIVRAEYQHGGTWTALAAGKVTMAAGRGRRQFEVDFTGAAHTPTAAAPVPVRVTYKKAFGAGGWGGADSLHLLICRGHYEDESAVGFLSGTPDGQIIVACIHEPGHALGLVNSAEPNHDASHSSHCTRNSCTMWFQSSPGNETFHDAATAHAACCRTYLRKADLSRSVMSSKWNFPR